MGADDERLLLGDLRARHRAARRGCDLAREPFVREEIRTVRQNIDDKPSIANRHHVGELGPRLRNHGERHDALVVLPEPKLAWRAEHPFRCLAANLFLLDFYSAQHRADGRERIKRVDAYVRCTAYHVQHRAASGIHFREPEVIGVGVPCSFDDAADHDVAQVLAQWNEIIHRRASRREEIPQLRWREAERDERTQPFVRGVHGLEALTEAFIGQKESSAKLHRAIWYRNLTSES